MHAHVPRYLRVADLWERRCRAAPSDWDYFIERTVAKMYESDLGVREAVAALRAEHDLVRVFTAPARSFVRPAPTAVRREDLVPLRDGTWATRAVADTCGAAVPVPEPRRPVSAGGATPTTPETPAGFLGDHRAEGPREPVPSRESTPEPDAEPAATVTELGPGVASYELGRWELPDSSMEHYLLYQDVWAYRKDPTRGAAAHLLYAGLTYRQPPPDVVASFANIADTRVTEDLGHGPRSLLLTGPHAGAWAGMLAAGASLEQQRRYLRSWFRVSPLAAPSAEPEVTTPAHYNAPGAHADESLPAPYHQEQFLAYLHRTAPDLYRALLAGGNARDAEVEARHRRYETASRVRRPFFNFGSNH